MKPFPRPTAFGGVLVAALVLSVACGDENSAKSAEGSGSSGSATGFGGPDSAAAASDGAATTDTGSAGDTSSGAGWPYSMDSGAVASDTAVAETSKSGWEGSSGADSASDSGGGNIPAVQDAAASDTAGASEGSDSSAAADGASADAATGNAEDQAALQVWKQMTEAATFAQVSIGGNKKLELVDVRVTVQIEGLRARTLVDHIYKNPTNSVVQGTFRYSLPTDAGVSYYAMFAGQPQVTPQFFGSGDQLKNADDEMIAGTAPEVVGQFADPKLWGTLQEAKIASQVQATVAYETEIAKKIDPALGEVVGPNTFEAKVYPIAANGYNRVLIAYEQTLPRVKGKLRYAYAVPKTDPVAKTNMINTFEFTALIKNATNGGATATGTFAGIDSKTTKTATVAKVSAQGELAGGVLAWDITPTAAELDVATGTDPTTAKAYTLVRVQAALPQLAGGKAYAKRAVFLLDTSRSEHQRFGSSMALLDGILAQSPAIAQFAVVTFDAGARWLKPDWQTNDAAGRQAVKDALDGVVLEGATDFGAALRSLTKPPMAMGADSQLDVFVLSDGGLNWGDTGLSSLMGRYTDETPWQARFFSYRIGIGAENTALYQALAQGGGAVFNCEGGALVVTCATAHHGSGIVLQSVELLADGPTGAQFADLVVAGRQATLFPGGTLMLAAQVVKPGAAKLVIKGTAPGIGPQTLILPLEVQPKGQLAPRAWAEIAIALLVDAHDSKLDALTLALSQHFRVASAVASFLVLEDAAAYKKYGIADESGKLANLDLAALLLNAQKSLLKVWTSWHRLDAVFKNFKQYSMLVTLQAGQLYTQMQALAPPSDLTLPEATTLIPLVYAPDVPQAYLGLTKQAQVDAFNPLPWFVEGERRRKLGLTGAAIRATSTAVENKAADPEVARLVGYQLRAWDQAALATGALLGVLEKRPFEPQSYRDLALAIGTTRPVVTAMLFEATLAGSWNSKFMSIKIVAAEEYSIFIAADLSGGAKPALTTFLKGRSSQLSLPNITGKLRVTLTWNTDATDIDLWVTDPLGQKCYYQNKTLNSGGQLLEDLIDGYGPERFEAKTTIPGTYTIEAHYYGASSAQAQPWVFVNSSVLTDIGLPTMGSQASTVVLQKVGQVAQLAKVTFK